MTEDKILIRQVLDGDTEAFAGLVSRYEKQVYGLCLRMVSHPEDARDLAQEAFLRAWRGLPFYKSEASFSIWLYRLTSNVCIDFLRQQKRRPTASLTVGDEEPVEMEVPDDSPTPEEQTLHREERTAVAAAFSRLDEEARLALTLRVTEDLPYEKIAEILNLKIGTVKSRIARARMQLRKILSEDGNYPQKKTSKQSEGGMRHDL